MRLSVGEVVPSPSWASALRASRRCNHIGGTNQLKMWALTGHVLVDNALLTNLGRLDEPPSFGPDTGPTVELWVSTPARSPLTLSLGAVTIGGRLHLILRYPNRLFGPEAARRFAEGYLRQLLLVAHRRS